MGYLKYVGTDAPHAQRVVASPYDQHIVAMPGDIQLLPDQVSTWLLANDSSDWQPVAGPAPTSGPTSLAGHTTGSVLPENMGVLGWTFDIATGASGVAALPSQQVVASKIILPAGSSQGMGVGVSTAGSALVAGTCFGLLIAPSGEVVAATTDQSVGWSTVGFTPTAWTEPVDLTGGEYFLGLVASGTTRPKLLGATAQENSALNFVMNGATPRSMTLDTGVTSVPAQVSIPGGSTATLYWAVVY